MSKLEELKAAQKKTGQSWTPPPREAVKIEPIGATGSDVPSSSAPEPVVSTQQPNQVTAPPAAAPPIDDRPPATRVDPRTRPVDTTARIMPFGSHLYPDRHKQVLYEAFMLDIKPWEVIEVALAEYFERRYGDPAQANMNNRKLDNATS
jgi:hypothetical protein